MINLKTTTKTMLQVPAGEFEANSTGEYA